MLRFYVRVRQNLNSLKEGSIGDNDGVLGFWVMVILLQLLGIYIYMYMFMFTWTFRVKSLKGGFYRG